jgi:hypothetical protein
MHLFDFMKLLTLFRLLNITNKKNGFEVSGFLLYQFILLNVLISIKRLSCIFTYYIKISVVFLHFKCLEEWDVLFIKFIRHLIIGSFGLIR